MSARGSPPAAGGVGRVCRQKKVGLHKVTASCPHTPESAQTWGHRQQDIPRPARGSGRFAPSSPRPHHSSCALLPSGLGVENTCPLAPLMWFVKRAAEIKTGRRTGIKEKATIIDFNVHGFDIWASLLSKITFKVLTDHLMKTVIIFKRDS